MKLIRLFCGYAKSDVKGEQLQQTLNFMRYANVCTLKSAFKQLSHIS